MGKDYNEVVVKIKAKNNEGNTIKIFTGSFYNAQKVDMNSTFIITAKHCVIDENIQNLELNYYFKDKFYEPTIDLRDYSIVEHPKLDLCIIKIKKNIDHNWNARICNSDILKNINYNYLNSYVIVPGFYDEFITLPIYENAQICSYHNKVKFYIKSKYITYGYSGSPVIIMFYDNSTYVMGFVSKNLGNDIIEVISSENIDIIESLINM